MFGSKPRVLVVVADGTEEMEAIIAVDVLRRAGAEVVFAGLDGEGVVTCSRGVRIVPDCALAAAHGRFDAVVLPGGGEGSERFVASAELGELLRAQLAAAGVVAAICAAPSALVAHGIGAGARMTSHPAVEAAVAAHGQYATSAVVVDGDLITSRGPGTAFPFALALVERLFDAATAAAVREPMMFVD